jgi:formyl-CoA transferase
LLRQQKNGEGAFIDVSMLDSALASMGWVISNYLIAGQKPFRWGTTISLPRRRAPSRREAGLLNIAANKQEQFEALAKAIGREGLASDPRFADREDRSGIGRR